MNKIKEEELNQILDMQKKFAAVRNDLGVLVIRKQELLKAQDVLVEENQNIMKGLEDIYGKVNINLEDGSYEEIKEEK
jgi:hypothetical protein|tara:strand:+ start:606 stop:839 length:234 start_codon:yes stop_codon:yes gene_type:complete